MVKLLSKIIICMFLTCKSSEKKNVISNVSIMETDSIINKKKKTVKSTIKTIEFDIFEFDSIKVKGSGIFLKKNILEKKWSKFDSIKNFSAECGYLAEKDSVKIYYVNGCSFFVYEDYAELSELDFSLSNEKLVHPQITLRKGTELNEFEKFENSFRNRKESKKDNIAYTVLTFLPNKESDGRFRFLFVNGKLKSFYIWNPC